MANEIRDNENNNSGSENMSVASNALHTLLKNFLADGVEGVTFEMSNSNFRPKTYGIWLETDKKLTKKEAEEIFSKLHEGHICKSDEVEQFAFELVTFSKVKLAVLPRSYIVNFAYDIDQVIKNYDVFVSFSEFGNQLIT